MTLITFGMDNVAAGAERLETFPHLPALAERLGINPGEGDGKFWLEMLDGRRYDVFALVNAVLDRLDAATHA